MYNFKMTKKRNSKEERERIAHIAAFDVDIDEQRIATSTRKANKNCKRHKRSPVLTSDFISVAVPIALLEQKRTGRISSQQRIRTNKAEPSIVSNQSKAFSSQQMSELGDGVYTVFTFKVNANPRHPNPNSSNEAERRGTKRLEKVNVSTCAVFNGDLSIDNTFEGAVSGITDIRRMRRRIKDDVKLATLAPSIQEIHPSICDSFSNTISLTTRSWLDWAFRRSPAPTLKAYTVG